MDLIQALSILGSIVVFVLIIELIRRNYLKERYSLIWLAAAAVLMFFSIWRRLLDLISLAFGIYYPPSFLFLLAIAFLLALLIHFSTIASKLSDDNKRLAQEIGIIKKRVGDIEERDKTSP